RGLRTASRSRLAMPPTTSRSARKVHRSRDGALVSVEAVEEVAVLEGVLVEHMVRDPAIDQELADTDCFLLGESLVAREPFDRFASDEATGVGREQVAAVLDRHPARGAQAPNQRLELGVTPHAGAELDLWFGCVGDTIGAPGC